MHVFGIDDCPRIKKKLNSLFGSKGGGSMKRRFTLRSAVAHEATCFDIGRRRAIRIGTVRQKHLENLVVSRAIGLAKGCVEGRFPGIWLRIVDISTALDEELAKLPVTVKHRSIQVEIFSERLQGFAFGEQESHGTDVAVVGAPFDERHSIAIRGCRGVAISQVVKYQVGAAVRDSVKHDRLFVSGHLLPSRHNSLEHRACDHARGHSRGRHATRAGCSSPPPPRTDCSTRRSDRGPGSSR